MGAFTNNEQGKNMNKHKYFITDAFISKVDPNKICITWHDRLNPFFGTISLLITDGKVVIDSEYKNRRFVKEILNNLVDSAELIGEPDETQ